MSRQILAIDIRKDVIAAVLLNSGLKSNEVVGFAHVSLDGSSDRPEEPDQAWSSLFEQVDPSAANVVVALPPDGIIYRTLRVPFKDDSKIRQILPFELESLLPVPVDDLIIDFQKKVIEEQSEVLATAIDRNIFQDHMAALADKKLTPQLVVPGCFPLVLQFIAIGDQLPEQFLVLDLGREKTTLYAVSSGRVALVRALPSNVDTAAAVELLALKIRQTLTAFGESEASEFTPAAIYVSGPGLNAHDAIKLLAPALDHPVQTLDLRQWLPKSALTETLDWDPRMMNNALALALLESEGKPCPNFHRIRSPLRNYWAAYRPYIMAPAILLALALLLGLGKVWFTNHTLQKRVDKLDAQMEQIFKTTFPDTQRIKNLPAHKHMESKLKETKQDTAAPAQTGAQVHSLDILMQVSQLIPNDIDVILNRFVVGGDGVTISGETAGFNTVDDIKNRLEKSVIFKQVTIASANMDKSGKKVRFKLRIDL